MTTHHPLIELTLNRLRQFYREPEAVFWVYGFPIMLTILLGIAFRNKPVERVPVDIQDGPGADEIRAVLAGRDDFEVAIQSADRCAERLRLGRTTIYVVPGVPLQAVGESNLKSQISNLKSEISRLYVYDSMRPESAYARLKLDDTLQRAAGRGDAFEVRDQLITEPGARYIDFLLPGLLGMNLMGGGLWGLGFVTVDMRVRKLLKRLIATPMRKRDFLLSIIAGRMAFMVPEVILILLSGWLIFDVAIRGGLLPIAIVCFIGAASFAGLGLLIASRAQKIETVSGLMNLVMLPMWLFSGIFFSSERFPSVLQPFIQALPLTQLNKTLRAVILEGAPLWTQGLPLVILSAWGTVSFVLALRWFRWT